MSALVEYRVDGGIATITMDDGKVNALSPGMLSEVGGAFDRAEADRAIVVLTGREGVFSAGFDLRVLTGGGEDAYAMLMKGFRLAERMLSFPMPIVIACAGHALAMGAFLLLSGDYRFGVEGPFKVGANEVAIGLTMPFSGVEICRQRLAPAYFNRAAVNAEIFTPAQAQAAGFLDQVVPAPDLERVAHETAGDLIKLDMDAHAATKLRAREQSLQALRAAIEADDAFFRARI
jgi:enoyl-CoA hydratase